MGYTRYQAGVRPLPARGQTEAAGGALTSWLSGTVSNVKRREEGSVGLGAERTGRVSDPGA